MCGGVDCWEYTFIYFTKKDVTHVLSVFYWDVNCGEVLSIIQSEVFLWMGFFIIGLIKFDENLTHGICRKFNTWYFLMRVNLDNNMSFEGIISIEYLDR